MKPTIAQFLKVQKFPFQIKDKDGNQIYTEYSNGYWIKNEYDLNGNLIYVEDSYGYWIKNEYDLNGKEIFYENSNGEIIDNRSKPVLEITLEEIAALKGVSVSQIRIKE
jgi:hypothetical protein